LNAAEALAGVGASAAASRKLQEASSSPPSAALQTTLYTPRCGVVIWFRYLVLARASWSGAQ
jgi:hypothetical protein